MQQGNLEIWALIVVTAIVPFLLTIFIIPFLMRFAQRVGLTDKPGGRKTHAGNIPLVGGLAMYLGLCLSMLFLPITTTTYAALLTAGSILICTGLYDDFFNMSAFIKLGLQIASILVIIYLGNIKLTSFGDLFSMGVINLGFLSPFVTVFMLVGIINAINMMDGIDGMAGTITIVEAYLLLILAFFAGHFDAVLLLTSFIAVIAAFICFNFPYSRRIRAAIFMGDAGSMFLGLVIGIFTVKLSQGNSPAMPPALALWITVIPVMDTCTVMLRRIVFRRSPFTPDRSHMHHLLLNVGWSSMQICIGLAVINLVYGAIGIILYLQGVSQLVLMCGYLATFVVYLIIHSLICFKESNTTKKQAVLQTES